MTPQVSPTGRGRFGGMQVEPPIAAFVDEALAAEPIDPEEFWQGASEIIGDLAPRNQRAPRDARPVPT